LWSLATAGVALESNREREDEEGVVGLESNREREEEEEGVVARAGAGASALERNNSSSSRRYMTGGVDGAAVRVGADATARYCSVVAVATVVAAAASRAVTRRGFAAVGGASAAGAAGGCVPTGTAAGSIRLLPSRRIVVCVAASQKIHSWKVHLVHFLGGNRLSAR